MHIQLCLLSSPSSRANARLSRRNHHGNLPGFAVGSGTCQFGLAFTAQSLARWSLSAAGKYIHIVVVALLVIASGVDWARTGYNERRSCEFTLMLYRDFVFTACSWQDRLPGSDDVSFLLRYI